MKIIVLPVVLGLMTMAAVLSGPSGQKIHAGPWEPIGPSGGMIGLMAVHLLQTNRMVAVAQYYPFGVYLTSDAGGSWRHVFDLKSYSHYASVIDPFDPEAVHLLIDRGIYSTFDGGETWAFHPFPEHFEGTGMLLADKANSGALFVAARKFITSSNFDGAAMAVLKSTDGGATWSGTALSAASYLARTQCLAQDPADPRVLYAGGTTSDASGTAARIFRSLDGGTSWIIIPTPVAYNVFSIAVDPGDSRHLLAGTDNGLYQSRDGGASWTNVLPSAYVWRMAFDPGDSRIVYGGANDGFKKSTDGGATWQAGPSGVIKSKCTGLATAAAGRVFVSSQAGIRFSDDAGATWTDRVNGIRAGAANGVAVAPSSPNVVYFAGFYGEMFKSTDYGKTVTRLPFPQPTALVSNIKVNPFDADDLFVRGNGILRSRDGGQTWTPVLPICSDFVVGRADFNRLSAVGTVSTNNGDDMRIVYFASADGGAAWTSWTILDNPPLPTWSTAVAVDPVNPNIAYVGLNAGETNPAWESSVTNGFVLKTTDGGATWSEIGRWPERSLADVTADPAAPGFLYLATSDGIYKSQDGGASWRKTGEMSGAGYAREFEFHPLDPREIWVGLYDDVYFSRDRGETWSPTGGWSYRPYVTQIDFNPDGTLLYAGTWNTGAFRMRRTGGVLGVRITGTIQTSAGVPIPGVLVTLTNDPGTAVTDAAGCYAISVPTGWAGTLTPSANGWSFNPANRAYNALWADIAGQDFAGTQAPTIGLSKQRLNFGAVVGGGPRTSAQEVRVFNAGTGSLNWTAAADVPWLSVLPAAGTGARTVLVAVDPTGLGAGLYQGRILFSATGASNSPQAVEVRLEISGDASDWPPFGSFDTPVDGSWVAGSVAVTGWALDDKEVIRVEIKRDPWPGEAGPALGPDGLVYVGTAVFVPGARPDVAAAYPNAPLNDRAGFGYMLLTNMLPGGGNGPFSLHAVAFDGAGHSTRLGRVQIQVDNANSAIPFGAIDTPFQGGAASGPAFSNFGWVLTPWPKSMPRDGSTIWVFVDGIPLGHPEYNLFRQDVFDLFPGYANRDGAVGHFVLDTTKYADGLHTIAWAVEDDAGVRSGVGSRYFTVQNGAAGAGEGESGIFGWLLDPRPGLALDSMGPTEIKAEELGLVEAAFRIPAGMKIVGWGGTPGEGLPVGSTLNPETGIFSWMPGPGFLGRHVLHFAATDGRRVGPSTTLVVMIAPRDYRKAGIRHQKDGRQGGFQRS